MSTRTYTTPARKRTRTGVRFDPDSLRAAFHSRGWYSIPDAAEAIGVDPSTLYSILGGYRLASSPTAHRIKRALDNNPPTGAAGLLAGVDPRQLYCGSE